MPVFNPKKEFIIIRHSLLNGADYDLESAVAETLKLQQYIKDLKNSGR